MSSWASYAGVQGRSCPVGCIVGSILLLRAALQHSDCFFCSRAYLVQRNGNFGPLSSGAAVTDGVAVAEAPPKGASHVGGGYWTGRARHTRCADCWLQRMKQRLN
jgi:hypothetical protein